MRDKVDKYSKESRDTYTETIFMRGAAALYCHTV